MKKKSILKRILSLALIATMIISMFAGCNKNKSTENPTTEGDGDDSTFVDSDAATGSVNYSEDGKMTAVIKLAEGEFDAKLTSDDIGI